MAEFALQYTDAQERAVLERVRLMLIDLRPFWPAVSSLAISWIGRQFDSEGQFFGDPWAPLTPEYAAWKSTHYPGKPILSAEGDLRRAMTSPEREMLPTELVLKFPAYTHGGGGGEVDPEWFEGGTQTMPARPILFGDLLPGQARAELEAAAQLYVNEMLTRIL